MKKNIIVKLDRCTLKNMPTKKKSLNGVGLKKKICLTYARETEMKKMSSSDRQPSTERQHVTQSDLILVLHLDRVPASTPVTD